MSLEIFGDKEHGFSGNFTDCGEHTHRLRNCPFCGERHDLEIKNTHTPSYWIDCNNCGGQCSPAMPRFNRFKTERAARAGHERALQAAIDGWNRRPIGGKP